MSETRHGNSGHDADPLPADVGVSGGDGAGAAGVEPVLILRGVRKHYRRGSEDIVAAADVSLELYPGTLTCILGPSGGGKSTLLHLMGGMDRVSGGQILALGRDITRMKADELAAYRRTAVGFVFQSFHLLPTLTARENVELPMLLAGVPAPLRRQRAEALLNRFGLGDRALHRPGELSGGQAQRVAVARALALNPPLLLADEPTGNLDSQSGHEIMALLAQVAHEDGRTVVVVTHNEEFVAYADRVVRIRDGRIQSDEWRRPPQAAAAAAATRSPGVQMTDTSAEAGPAAPAAVGRGAPEAAAGRSAVGFQAILRLAASAVRRRLGRAVLTGSGIAIGVAAMVLLIGIGAGLKSGVVRGLATLGPLTSITVSPYRQTGGSGFGGLAASGPQTPITPDALRRLAALPGAKAAYATATFVARLTRSGTQVEADVVNLPPASLWHTEGLLPTLAAGRWPAAGGLVLAESTAKALLSGGTAGGSGTGGAGGATTGAGGGKQASPQSLIGKAVDVEVQGMTGNVLGGGAFTPAASMVPVQLRVIGIVQGTAFSYVSYPQALRWMETIGGGGGGSAGPAGGNHGGLPPGQAGAGRPVAYPGAVVIARSIDDVSPLAERIGKLGYGTTTVQDILKSITKAFAVIQAGLGVIGGIALVVAGLMIGVVLSMSVLERRREIGILRAVGAQNANLWGWGYSAGCRGSSLG